MLESLAARFGENAIGVLLSGSGHDGTLGLTAMHEMGGLTIAQSPASAEFSSMPASAIDAGIVDMVLEPDQIGTMLGTLGAGMAHVDE
jgi:two-component system CheB/CheR fusion protein